jgi:VWFA-related protein
MRRIVVFLSVAGLLAAQEPSKPDISETFKFILVPVTVTDRSGSFLNGLTPLDFHLTDNGQLQKISEDVTSHPLSMVVAIQANSDVEKILPTVKRLSSVFEALVLGDNGELAVMAFDHRVTTLTDFTSEPAKIDAAFKKLTPGSYSSNLNDAAMKGINLLRDRPKERRRVLVLIAENRDKGSDIKVREVLSAGEFANVVVYTVNVSQLLASLSSKAQPNRPNPIPPEARQLPAGVVGTPTTDMQMEMGNWVPAFKDIFLAAKGVFLPDPLDVYTKFTGGREFAFKTQKSLEKDISQLGEELHSQYFLTYFPSTQEEAGFHQIVVTVDRPSVKVRTRDGYYWAGKQP